jgi:TetR/AcrR family transcriptional regulator, mexJK operon transcriptional repressor
VLVSPAFVSLYVHTAAEAERFPEVGEALFARGPTQVYATVGGWLRRWEALGAVKVPDARAAAVQFVQLCLGDLAIRAQLGVTPQPTPGELRATVRRGVATFLRAYAP